VGPLRLAGVHNLNRTSLKKQLQPELDIARTSGTNYRIGVDVPPHTAEATGVGRSHHAIAFGEAAKLLQLTNKSMSCALRVLCAIGGIPNSELPVQGDSRLALLSARARTAPRPVT
jgi:hypothetical protein